MKEIKKTNMVLSIEKDNSCFKKTCKYGPDQAQVPIIFSICMRKSNNKGMQQ